MAEQALFVGWGAIRTGREAAAQRAFQESVAYWEGLKSKGEIESVEVVLLASHGGDLGGFALLRGEAAKLSQLRMSPEFQRNVLRATVLVDSVGVVNAYVDAGVQQAFESLREATADLV